MRLRVVMLALFFIIVSTGAAGADAPLGTNLAGVASWSTQHPFVDAFRTARPWISQCDGCAWGDGGPLALTPEGWVAALQPGQYADTIMLDGGHFPPGEFLVLYDGAGSIEFTLNSAQIVSQAPGRIVIVPNPNTGLFLRIAAVDTANPIRNIRVIFPGSESTYETQPFNAAFLQLIQPFDTLRFMDWMATNNSTVSTWEERPKPTDATFHEKGVPVEVMVALANLLRVNVWFNMPHLATDDYVTRFAEYVRDHLDPALKIYIEYSNETWNGQFSQAYHVIDQGAALGLSADDFQAGFFYHSRRAVEMFGMWEQVFGGTDRLVRVLASQAGNAWTGEQVITFEDAYRKADALAIAPYFSLNVAPEETDATLALGVDGVIDHLRGPVIGGEVREWLASHVDVLAGTGLQLLAYEGGQHLVGVGGAENNDTLTLLLQTVNRDSRMRDLYLDYFALWNTFGGGLFMHFTDVGPYSQWGSWGALEYLGQEPASAPKYQALLAYLNG